MSFRQRLDGPSTTPGRPSGGGGHFNLNIALHDDGRVELRDESGSPLSPRMAKLTREAAGDQITAWLKEQCERWNKGVDRLVVSHIDTPPPHALPEFEEAPSSVAPPQREPDPPPGFLARFSRKRRERYAEECQSRADAHEVARGEWASAYEHHLAGESQKRERFDSAMHGTNTEAMNEILEEKLAALEFPWESGVSFEVATDGTALWIDLDLPEIEDMPQEAASVATRGLRISIKRRSDTQVRKEYMALVHALAFRVAGESFAALPTVQVVTISAYSQRADRRTGHVRDEYLISSRIERDSWLGLAFNNLAAADVIAVFDGFDTIRKVTKTGVFTAIEPHAPGV